MSITLQVGDKEFELTDLSKLEAPGESRGFPRRQDNFTTREKRIVDLINQATANDPMESRFATIAKLIGLGPDGLGAAMWIAGSGGAPAAAAKMVIAVNRRLPDIKFGEGNKVAEENREVIEAIKADILYKEGSGEWWEIDQKRQKIKANRELLPPQPHMVEHLARLLKTSELHY